VIFEIIIAGLFLMFVWWLFKSGFIWLVLLLGAMGLGAILIFAAATST
jgi:hypothetical protein